MTCVLFTPGREGAADPKSRCESKLWGERVYYRIRQLFAPRAKPTVTAVTAKITDPGEQSIKNRDRDSFEAINFGDAKFDNNLKPT